MPTTKAACVVRTRFRVSLNIGLLTSPGAHLQDSVLISIDCGRQQVPAVRAAVAHAGQMPQQRLNQQVCLKKLLSWTPDRLRLQLPHPLTSAAASVTRSRPTHVIVAQ